MLGCNAKRLKIEAERVLVREVPYEIVEPVSWNQVKRGYLDELLRQQHGTRWEAQFFVEGHVDCHLLAVEKTPELRQASFEDEGEDDLADACPSRCAKGRLGSGFKRLCDWL